MKIKSVGCDQFAGLKDQKVEFSDGLNLMIGENESGKSTLADLIYQILFQPAKLRKTSEFIEKYFPKTVSGGQADFVDGELSFETEAGTFKLTKEWECGKGSTRLTQPGGIAIKTPDEVESILRQQLKFKDGVYREIIFPSQKREQWVLETILNGITRDKTTAEIRESFEATLTKAALETGGVSLNRLEGAIQDKLTKLGAHWDAGSRLPEGGVRRGINNPWKTGVGEILKAWYGKEEIRLKLEEAEEAERKIEDCIRGIKELEAQKKQIRDKQEQFRQVRESISRRNTLEKLLAQLEKEIRQRREVQKNWPHLEADLKLAQELKKNLELAQIRRMYEEARNARKAVEAKEEAFKGLIPVDEEEAALYRQLKKDIEDCKQQLSGMNIAAKIERLGAQEVIVTAAATGQPLTEQDGQYLLTGAAQVEIPGVMRMSLAPAGVDAEAVGTRLKEAQEEAGRLEEKYGVESVEELWEKKSQYQRAGQELQAAKEQMERLLGETSYEELSRKALEIPADLKEEGELKEEIRNLCGARPIDGYIGGLRSQLEGYESQYQSRVHLDQELSEQEEQAKNEREELAAVQQIPAEFASVEDPASYDRQMGEQLDRLEEQAGNLKKRQGEAENSLSSGTAEEYAEQLEQLQGEFQAKEEEYGRWQEIQKTFYELKEESAGNPAQDIVERFAAYLKELSDGRLELTGMGERFDTTLSSGDYALACDYLSEGTKDTVLLAFRLAMLKHLFPEGGGLAVFDDPFTDLDPARLSRACALIQEFARQNQVIFITCDEKYRNMLDGNVIELS